MFKQIIVTGIGTDIGKTIVSAILTEALQGSYWKPIQAGDLDASDSLKVKALCSEHITILPETYRLNKAISPHAAANIDGIKIENIKIPSINSNLIIEGAGGLMVPLNNDGLLYSDLIKEWNIPVILVSKHYIGSINHTLMTAEILKNKNIQVEGIIFVGDENIPSESIILKLTKLKYITRIPFVKEVTKEFIQKEAFKLTSKI